MYTSASSALADVANETEEMSKKKCYNNGIARDAAGIWSQHHYISGLDNIWVLHEQDHQKKYYYRKLDNS